MIDVSLLKCFMKCCSMIFWASCSCDTHTLFLIVVHNKYLLMFHVLSFCCFKHSGVTFGIFYFSYEVFRSSLSGISNFLIHLFEYLGLCNLSLMTFCSFDILSRTECDIWWIFTFFLYPTWVSVAHLIISLSFSYLFSCCAATYVVLSVSCSICSLHLSWFSSFCVVCLVLRFFWASFEDKFLPMSVIFLRQQVCGPMIFLYLRMNVHRSGLACSSDSR